MRFPCRFVEVFVVRRVALAGAAFAILALAAVAAPARPDPAACKNLIKGTPASESLDGTPANDRIMGLGGDDRLIGEAGNDCLDGGLDADQLIGATGDDRLVGAGGNDMLEGDDGADDLDGEEGTDRLDGGAAADRLWGGGGTDFLRGQVGNDRIRGEGGVDRIEGGPGRDTIDGGPGSDDIREVAGGYIAGETLDYGHNRIATGPGRDRLDVANGRRDVVACGPGKDTVKADKGDRLKKCEKRRYLISPFPEVLPHRGGRTRGFLVKFRSLDDVSRSGEYFSIEVKGPAGKGCGTLVADSTGMAYHRDKAVRYRLRPFHGNGRKAKRWCRGRYTGKVAFVREGAKAERVPIGRFSFQVRG